MRKYHVDAVFHFAANSAVGESIHNPRKYYGNNLVNSIGLFDAMLDVGVHRIVLSSTCAIYGDPQAESLDETHPQKPVNPYGETKLAIERALEWYGRAYGIDWVALRYFNAAGADEEGEIGELHDPETHLIPLVLEAALDATRHIRIFGTDYPTSDGTAIRDYIHVTDLADAHICAFRYMTTRTSGTFNLGTGLGHSVREVVAAVQKVTARIVPTVEAARRAGDPPRLVASNIRAAGELKWKAKRSLEEIIQTAWQWRVGFAGQGARAINRAS
jgi:UDP-glucose-4-epimerase GalE